MFCPLAAARGRWCVRTLRAEELAGDVESLTSHNDDLLAVEQLLGHGAGEATEQVPLAVDDLVVESASGPTVFLVSCGLSRRAMAGRRGQPAAICSAWESWLRAYIQ